MLLLGSVAARALTNITATTVKTSTLNVGTNGASGGGAPTDYVAFWTLNEASGATRVDSSANAQDLTDTGTVLATNGIVSNAAEFFAAGGKYLSRADSATLSVTNTSFTFCVWVTNYTHTGFGNVYINKSSDTAHLSALNEYDLRLYNGTDHYSFSVGNGTTYTNIDASIYGIPTTGWHFIIAWYDLPNTKLCIQVCTLGSMGATNSVTYSSGVQDGTNPFYVGTTSGNTGISHDGRIDQLRIYKRVLTEAEKIALYNGGNGL